MTPNEIIALETVTFGRKLRLITGQCSMYRDHNGTEHETIIVIYDASLDRQGQTRWCVYTDGEQQYSGIVSAGFPSPVAREGTT